MTEVQRISEQWGGSQCCAPEGDDSGVIPVNNTIALIGGALFAGLSYLHTRSDPELYVGEARALRDEVAESAPRMARTALGQAMFPTWGATISQNGQIWCDVHAQWTLERDTPSARMRLAYNAAICCPVLLVQRTFLLFRQITFCFTKRQQTASKRLDVAMGFGGEKLRAPGSGLVKSLLAPYAPRRVYLPEGSLTKKGIQTAVEDMYALFCMYCVQERFISVEDDLSVQKFLLAYMRQYKHAKQFGEGGLFWEILSPRRVGRSRSLKNLTPEERQCLARYAWPDDYRALRKYVSTSIRGIVISSLRSESASRLLEPMPQAEFFTVPRAAALVGIPRTTLYRYVKEGKIQTRQECIDDKSQTVIPAMELHRLEQQKSQDEMDNALLKYCAERRGIDPKSIQRKVQRLKKQGINSEAIRQQLHQEAQQRCEDDEDYKLSWNPSASRPCGR